VIAVALAIAAFTAVGVAAERRFGARAQAASRGAITALLWTVLPFVTFFNIARLELDAGVGGGLALAYAELAVVGLLAYVAGSRLLGLARHQTGALIVVCMLANTGYLGVPLTAALLGTDELAEAIAFDAVVSGPMFVGFAFAVGAAFGTTAGESAAARTRAFFLRNPPLLAVVAGLLAPDALAPDALVDAAEVLVFAVVPVGFFILGVNLATEAEEGSLAFPPPFTGPVAATLVLRLVVAPALMLGLSAAVVAVPHAYLVQAAMPSGINSLVVAHAYGLDLKLTASAIAWTTAVVVVAAVAGSFVV
jgi:malate permease and related proteins